MTEALTLWQSIWRWVTTTWTFGTRLQRLETKLDGFLASLEGHEALERLANSYHKAIEGTRGELELFKEMQATRTNIELQDKDQQIVSYKEALKLADEKISKIELALNSLEKEKERYRKEVARLLQTPKHNLSGLKPIEIKIPTFDISSVINATNLWNPDSIGGVLGEINLDYYKDILGRNITTSDSKEPPEDPEQTSEQQNPN